MNLNQLILGFHDLTLETGVSVEYPVVHRFFRQQLLKMAATSSSPAAAACGGAGSGAHSVDFLADIGDTMPSTKVASEVVHIIDELDEDFAAADKDAEFRVRTRADLAHLDEAEWTPDVRIHEAVYDTAQLVLQRRGWWLLRRFDLSGAVSHQPRWVLKRVAERGNSVLHVTSWSEKEVRAYCATRSVNLDDFVATYEEASAFRVPAGKVFPCMEVLSTRYHKQSDEGRTTLDITQCTTPARIEGGTLVHLKSYGAASIRHSFTPAEVSQWQAEEAIAENCDVANVSASDALCRRLLCQKKEVVPSNIRVLVAAVNKTMAECAFGNHEAPAPLAPNALFAKWLEPAALKLQVQSDVSSDESSEGEDQ